MNCLKFFLLIICLIDKTFSQSLPLCDSQVYCQGELLDKIQMAQLFDDSKSFVDMSQKNPSEITLDNFQKLLQETDNNPSKDDLKKFLDKNFENQEELQEWIPEDYTESPSFLTKIQDEDIKQFAQDLVKQWPKFGRKIKEEIKEKSDQHSLIPVKNGFIVPGGRFNEFYYWDTFWIINGLLLCEMYDTVRGILENFFEIVEKYSFIPNGARVYYLNRSQPPLLTLMVQKYYEFTGDTEFLQQNIKTLNTELKFWLKNRKIEVDLGDKTYSLFHYNSQSGTPRPESYFEDVQTASAFQNEDQKSELYSELKSAAESGWDFSSRWMVNKNSNNEGNLTDAHTTQIIPVDLNSFLCQAFTIMSKFYSLLNKPKKSLFWLKKSENLKSAIKDVFFDENDGVWYDFNYKLSQKRKNFYPSNLTPLWSEINHEIETEKIVNYLNPVLSYNGGIPASLKNTGQQWDLPAAWPPLQEIVINALLKSGNNELAYQLAEKWIKSNMEAFNKYGAMFEKYDAENPGESGGGGEYEVQKGFGWTNGVALMLINEFFLK